MLGRDAKRRAVGSKSTPTLTAGLTRDESYELSLSLLNLEQFGHSGGGHSSFPAEGGALAAREKQLSRSRSEASTKLIHSLRWVAKLARRGGGWLTRSIARTACVSIYLSFVRSFSICRWLTRACGIHPHHLIHRSDPSSSPQFHPR